MKNQTALSRAPRGELERLLGLQHHDPHSILGAHVEGNRVVVRAFRPAAVRIELIVESEAPLAMRMIDPAGLFEAVVEGRSKVFRYQFEIHYQDGESITIHDPYSFLPTLGDLDLPINRRLGKVMDCE